MEEHKRSTIGKQVKDEHGKDPETREIIFKILEKYLSKPDCLIFEMLFIRELKKKIEQTVWFYLCKSLYLIDSLLILFFSPQRFLSFLPQFSTIVFFLCKYLGVLVRTHWHFFYWLYKPMINNLSLNLKMNTKRSKRSCFLTLIF